jgi:hypothetical protein
VLEAEEAAFGLQARFVKACWNGAMEKQNRGAQTEVSNSSALAKSAKCEPKPSSI